MTPYDRLLSCMTRRQLLDLAWRLGAAAVAVPVAGTARTLAQPIFREYPFQLGVASGEPLPDGIVLWTRLAPDPLNGGGMPMARVEVTWEVARDEFFRTIVSSGTATAHPELGHSVHVEVQGLEPAREYWYRFRAGREMSPTVRTRTAPAAGAAVDRLRFAVCGCNHYETGFFTAYQHLAEQQFDFVFHTGDYIYEDRADGGRNTNRVRQHHGDEIVTLVDYRNRYAQYKLDPALRAAHHSAPFIVTWDDHEVDNDYAGDHDEFGTPPEVFLLRRTAAYQAYYEHMPLRRAQWPAGPSLTLYRRMQFGSLIDLSVLDTRQYRSDQACGGGMATNCAEALDPSRTILGADQERWLFQQLAGARARWTVIGQQVPTYARDNAKANPDGRFAMDKWDGYVASRQRLYARLKEAKTPNPLVLSGDVHLHYGADLKLDFTNPASETIGAEFTNSSISSAGDGGDVAPNWEATRADNPHIKYHSGRRGYIDCTATPSTLRADFKIVERVSVPGLPVATGGTLVMEAGKPGCARG
jgi:alkaline phosphatase D